MAMARSLSATKERNASSRAFLTFSLVVGKVGGGYVGECKQMLAYSQVFENWQACPTLGIYIGVERVYAPGSKGLCQGVRPAKHAPRGNLVAR